MTDGYMMVWSQEAVDTIRNLPGRVVMIVLSNLALLLQTPRPAIASHLNVEIGSGLYRLTMPGNVAIVDYDVADHTVRILAITPHGTTAASPAL
jgi:mRNA-degrading endonuclease RelE of RelBE toxin-antitoxin system